MLAKGMGISRWAQILESLPQGRGEQAWAGWDLVWDSPCHQKGKKHSTYGLDNDENRHLLSTYSVYLLTTLRGRCYQVKREETGFSQSCRLR